MQTVRIVITGGKVRSVGITETPKPKTNKEIAKLLRSMPKEMLADALGIKPERQVTAHE